MDGGVQMLSERKNVGKKGLHNTNKVIRVFDVNLTEGNRSHNQGPVITRANLASLHILFMCTISIILHTNYELLK